MYFPLDNFFVDPTIIVSTRTTRKHIAGTSTLQKEAGYFESLPNETHFFDSRILFVNSTMLVYSILKGYPV